MNQLHTMRNPWSVNGLTVQCRHCHQSFTAQRINCFDTLLWPESRQVLEELTFFRPVCPHCQGMTELLYPSRYIDAELGVTAVLVPDIENQDADEQFSYLNRYLGILSNNCIQHRVVGNFYALAEQMRIRQHGLNDRAVQLLKPLIIGSLQSRGLEVWNGFFMNLIHPETAQKMNDTIYFSTQEDQSKAYGEDIYQFDIYLTNGDIIPHGINDTAYQICMNIVDAKGFMEDDGQFHHYDLSWAINVHNSLHED